MGLKAKRVCDVCLLEQQEDFFINRQDIKEAKRCSDVGWIVNWLCIKCKNNKKLLGESVDPTIEKDKPVVIVDQLEDLTDGLG